MGKKRESADDLLSLALPQDFTELANRQGSAIDKQRVIELHARIEPQVQAAGFRLYSEVLDRTAAMMAAELDLEVPVGQERFLSASLPGWSPFPDTGPALEALKGAGYRLGILSNVDEELIAATLRHIPVPFDLVITAEKVGSYKPATGHFVAARQQIGEASWLHVASPFSLSSSSVRYVYPQSRGCAS